MIESIAVKVVAGLLLALALFMGGFLYGHHVGSLAGTAQVASLQKAQAQALAQATQAASATQEAADAAALQQAQMKLADANAAEAAHAQAVSAANDRIKVLQQQLAKLGTRTPKVSAWLSQPIPHEVLATGQHP